jgi:hypothetical protein
MQATLPTIGHKTLDQVALLGSHDSGASEITKSYVGVKHNTLTQSEHIYEQLVSGTRYFDIRPVLRKGKWYTSHLTVINKSSAFGALTRSLDDVIRDINSFTARFPGELIILDISHDLSRRNWAPLSDIEWMILYQQLSAIEHLWEALVATRNLVTFPLSAFIQPGSRSAVVIRVPQYAPFPGEKRLSSPMAVTDSDDEEDSDESEDLTTDTEKGVSKEDASHPIAPSNAARVVNVLATDPNASSTLSHLPVFQARSFPIRGKWSNTLSATYLTKDQLAKLRSHKLNRTRSMFCSIWTMTQNWQQVLNVGLPNKSILSFSTHAHREMYKSLWKAVKQEKMIPNLVEIDDVRGRSIIAFVMAINHLRTDPSFTTTKSNHTIPVSATSNIRRRKRAVSRLPEDGVDSARQIDTISDAQDFAKYLNITSLHLFPTKYNSWIKLPDSATDTRKI